MCKNKKIINIIKRNFKIKDRKELEMLKKDEIKISELKNYDSMVFLEFLSIMEKEFNLKINNNNIEKFNKLKLIEKIINKTKQIILLDYKKFFLKFVLNLDLIF